MEIVKYSDLDFSSMKKLSSQGSTSTVYDFDNYCVKMLDKMSVEDQNQIRLKFLEMDGLEVDGLLLPKKLIFKNNTFVGYFMDKFPSSMNLYDYFGQKVLINFKELNDALYKASIILRNAHSNELILQDFSFDNILIDKDGNVKVCDIDGCSYKGYQGAYMSMIIINYYRVIFKELFTINKELDKQSLLFSMIIFIYGTYVSKMKEYDKLSSKSQTLSNIRPIFESLLRDLSVEIPYLDELIDLSDNFVLDRVKQMKRNRISLF